MGCCTSTSADGDELDSPQALKKEGKAKILTSEPSSHLELHERTCNLADSGSGGAFDVDEDLVSKVDAAVKAKADSAARTEAAIEAIRQAEEEEEAARVAKERAQREEDEQKRREAEERKRREAAEQAKRVASLTAAIGNTVARAKPPTRIQALATAAALQLDDKAALSAFTR